ncbi:helix-turn-helix transcriptional regulator [Acidimicrobiia bacterium]|nr:helix-turn-helix transcriptional regulator [Acidimicrobiia bacterium]|tara:strand:+ start:142 stop:624 length:483 start_codon:yes stop_codon:yes gene_type:complete
MNKRENTPLNKNELEIVKLTIQGESQISIAKQLDLSPSTVSRTLKRPHVKEKIKSSTQELHYPIYQKMMDNYARGLERIGREIDTMDIRELNKYLGHTKPLIMAMIIETARDELKKQMQAQEGPIKFNIKYSDTDQTNRREALRLLQEWGYDEPPEEVVN